MKKSRSVKIGLVVAILTITVGFAVVSTTLNMNGSTSVTQNQDDFAKKVTFADETGKAPTLTASDATKQASVTAPTLSADKKTITFTTPAMNTVGEKYTLTYNVKNENPFAVTLGGTTCTLEYAGEGEAPANPYVKVAATNGFNTKTVAANSTTDTTDTVVVEMIRSFVGENDVEYTVTCELSASADAN